MVDIRPSVALIAQILYRNNDNSHIFKLVFGEALLRRLAGLRGIYVPSLYRVTYTADGTVDRFEPAAPEARLPVLKRIVPRLPPPLTRFIVPYVDVTHNRIPIEIQRGCTRGCRFCQAGMITRPVRERPVAEVVDAIEQGQSATYAYLNLGVIAFRENDAAEAARWYELALRNDSTNWKGWNNYGLVREAQGDTLDAIHAFRCSSVDAPPMVLLNTEPDSSPMFHVTDRRWPNRASISR